MEKAQLGPSLIQALRPAWTAGAILAAAVLAAWLGPPLPPSLVGLNSAGPYTLIAAALAVAAWFNRERAFVLSLSLLAAFAAYDFVPAARVYSAAAVLVPANAVLALVFPERGARFGQAWKWLALLLCEAALVYVVRDALPLESFWLRTPPAPPLVSRLAFAAALAAALWRAWPNHTPLEMGIAGALGAYFLACGWWTDAHVYAVFMAACGALLLVAVLQESHRMAFRDALTGLPNRRALEEDLRALEPPYVVAMVDVDHFKKFNDTHGHDIGDQVLKLVAARLDETAEGAARAFRYGGEEFTVLFRNAHLAEVMPRLEAMRAAVEMHKMTIRGKDRPKDPKEGAKRRTAGAPAKPDFDRTDQLLSVTVSIGGAEPGKRLKTPQEVVKGADEALYRAKERGRNRVSR
ncbi:MAG: GGDEF domain-containing protein [Betaproteobacteria bacterium]|nr:GGDEF domain-containing protein [Betaproteobacteria bacterium]